MALIDKETICAEIERRMTENCDLAGKAGCFGQRAVEDNDILAFIDTLPEQPTEGLDEEISRTYHDGSVANTDDIDHVAYENIARHFAEWGAEHLKK